ncbi:BLUF domain-containing protein [Ketobacter sp. MCCC 1A13808]|uniref:BLUF domain-containing protein n=1 Tax=Ketobacter sp. MCCC 1A13808 TaxID=2602738 RepID=UPI0012EC808C|nr:BLUF domain-containing protein [Ketobacter sp. MCCC 1A13808]MVF12228.1 BLUF domain-containing protein [Ketobacter sp. MCCC 1A13808]
MKRIVCIGMLPLAPQSRLSAPLMSSYDESRKFNSQHDVNGVFVVYKNIVLQVLEGEATAVASAAYRIRRDSRFERCSIIVNCDIEKPYFNTWFIRLVKPGVKTPQTFLAKLKKVLEKDFVFESPKDRKLYEDIFIAERNLTPEADDSLQKNEGAGPAPIKPHPIKPAPITQAVESAPASKPANPTQFVGCALSLSSWPKPTQMRLNPKGMKTCSLLSHRYVSYQHILSKEIWPSESELVEFLIQLQDAGTLLVKTGSDADTPMPVKAQNPVPEKADRFSHLLKKFITTPKKQAN